ncbi:conjugative transposon protein TraK [Myroides sp. LJL119]
MEFKSLKNIESSFNRIRLFTFSFIAFCTLVVLGSLWASFSFAAKQREKIYVLDQGKSLILALSQDVAINRPVEAREHVRRFHELFFSLSPDKAAIESNIQRALYLSDKSAFKYYKDLLENGYYTRIISGNVQQRVEIDSIRISFDTYPYKTITYANQYIIRASNVTKRSLITSLELSSSIRSDNNPQGFIIENLVVIQNKDIQVINR